MIYEDADNSLETPQLANVQEMLQVGSTDKVQIVMLCDRSPESEPKDRYSDAAIGGLPNWSGAKLLHVEKGRLKQLADWGNTNMADPKTLTRFMEAAAKAYPADKYGLIIADHGSGWSALCVDETSGDAVMSLRQLREGISPFVPDHGKLELLGLDACLMGSFETAQALAPVVHYMVASEELAPGRGWNYDAFLKSLVEKPTFNGFDLGRTIVDFYIIHFNQSKDVVEQSSSLAVTLSVLDLDQFPALETAVSGLADECVNSLHRGRDGWIRVARPRARAEEYGFSGVRGEDAEEQMHDLMDLVRLFELGDDKSLAQAAIPVDQGIRKLVRYYVTSPCTPHAGGISIYFPMEGIDLKDPLGSEYLSRTFSRDCKWVNFLSLYSVAVNDFAELPKLLPLKFTAATAAPDKPVEILSKLTSPDYDKIHFITLAHDGRDLLVIGRLPTRALPDGTLGQRFNGAWYHLSDGKRGITCPVASFEPLDDKGQKYLLKVPVEIKRADSEKWVKAQMTFLEQPQNGHPHGQFLYAFAHSKQGPLQIPLLPGDTIRPIYTRILQDRGVVPWTGKSGFLIDDPKDFQLAWGFLGKGTYKLGFEVINLAGLSAIEADDCNLD